MPEYRFTDPETGEKWLARSYDGPLGREILRLAEQNASLHVEFDRWEAMAERERKLREALDDFAEDLAKTLNTFALGIRPLVGELIWAEHWRKIEAARKLLKEE